MPRASLLARYYAFRVTNAAGFFVPVTTVVLLDKGFDMEFVLFSYALLSFASVAAEIPSGYAADYLGRRWSLGVATVGRVGVYVSYPFLESGAALLAVHVLWATARAFRSGTADAWLYELLAAAGGADTDQFARVESRGSSLLLATSAATAVSGAVLYGVDPAFPFLANGALAAAGVPLLATIPDPDVDTDRDADAFTVRDAAAMLRVQVHRPEVRWLVAYAGLFAALFAVTKTYEQPALHAVGVPVEGLGVLYAGFKLVSAGAAALAGWLEEQFGARGVFGLMAPVYGVSFVAVAFVPVLVVPVLFLNRGGRIVTRPVRNQYLNDRLGDVGRATVLSGAALVLALAAGVARVVTGVAVSGASSLAVIPAAGGLVALTAGVLWVSTSPVRASPGTETPAGAAAADD